MRSEQAGDEMAKELKDANFITTQEELDGHIHGADSFKPKKTPIYMKIIPAVAYMIASLAGLLLGLVLGIWTVNPVSKDEGSYACLHLSYENIIDNCYKLTGTNVEIDGVDYIRTADGLKKSEIYTKYLIQEVK